MLLLAFLLHSSSQRNCKLVIRLSWAWITPKYFFSKLSMYSICIVRIDDKSNDKSNHPAFLLVIFCLLPNFLTWLVLTSMILEQSATRIIFSWTVVSLFSVRPWYWSNDLYSAWRIDGRKHQERTTTIHKLQHCLICTAQSVVESRPGKAYT